jgi:SAM-dependent methyltransferase
MNYKLLFPTYRQRHRFIRDQLARVTPPGGFRRGLNLGTGEGDYDPLVAAHCARLDACDVNEADLAFARQLNRHLPHVTYALEDAQRLTYPDAAFDLVVSTDVIEHVPDSAAMMRELGRVLAPGGVAVVTFPSRRFPATYDPLNRLLGRGAKRFACGAYAYGHFKLILDDEFEAWAAAAGLRAARREYLTGPLGAVAELYWPGLLQRLLKANAANAGTAQRGPVLRPSLREPRLLALTDAWIALDRAVSRGSRRSVGVGYVLEKPAAGGPGPSAVR